VLPAASLIDDAVSERARQPGSSAPRESNSKMHGALRQAGDELLALASFGLPTRSSSRGVGDGRGPRGSWFAVETRNSPLTYEGAAVKI
jgi:hypothetical protein